MYKHYGLVGQVVKVKMVHDGEAQKSIRRDPWDYGEQYMKVTYESPYFLMATVLPHTTNPQGINRSKPYPATLHKHDIQRGKIILNGGKIR